MMSGKGNLGYGLNSRKKLKKGGLTSFGGDDGDGSNSDGSGDGKSAINRDIAAEQAALRKRAKAAMAASALDPNIYDYDAQYDSFSSAKRKEDEARSAAEAAAKAKAARQSSNEPKAKAKPRYITNLLKTAQRRNQAQEIIYERKIAKEQAEEDAKEQYEGKEKFITSSYKRKLEEREQWAKEEEQRSKREAEHDVTKKKGMGSFMFGGIGRSLLVGNVDKKSDDNGDGNYKKEGGDVCKTGDGRGGGKGSQHEDYQHRESRETERGENTDKRNYDSHDHYTNRKRPPPPGSGGIGNAVSTNDKKDEPPPKMKTRQEILEERAIKIREARERHFKRRGIEAQ